MGTHSQAALEVAAAAAAATHTHTNANTNTAKMTNYNDNQIRKQEEDGKVVEERLVVDKSVEQQQQVHKEGNMIYLPQASEPPQVVIIPATQASTVATNAAKKIRRAFSMPRNPFRWSRKFKTSVITIDNDSPHTVTVTETRNNNNSSCSSNNSNVISCVSGGRTNAGSTVSLSGGYQAVTSGKDVTAATTICINNNNNNCVSNIKTPQITNDNISNNKKNSNYNENNPGSGCGNGGNRIIRRSSLRKFLNRIAQHVSSSINVGANKNSVNYANNGNNMDRLRNYATDRVPPITNVGYQWPADQTPGVMGLKNHGNTCFMNAVLQCLSHTDILAEYFVLDQYKVDLKRRNKINSRKFGTKGELTEQLANVLKALWTCKNESDHSTSFKAVVDRYGSQFRSSTQHDAQEFLFWLLDKVHEDLNTATKRRYKSVKNSYGRPDEVIAAETLANHIRCNNSFVQAVFQAQFRSSLTCPRCKKQSNTFDPFHCISVQLPQLTQQSVFVTVVYMKQQPRQVKMGITVPAGSPIVALRERLQQNTSIPSERMVLVDINNEGFSRVFYDTQPVATLQAIETIYCIEVPERNKKQAKRSSNSNINNSNIKNNNMAQSGNAEDTKVSVEPTASELMLLVACVRKTTPNIRMEKENMGSINQIKPADEAENELEDESIERFGIPFSMLVPRDCSFMELQKKLLKEMSSWLRPDVFTYSIPLSKMFQIRLQDPSADPDTYLEAVEHPLLTEMIDLALSVLSAEAGPAHIKLLLEWMEPEQYFVDLSNLSTTVEHESVARLRAQKTPETVALSLEQCLEHYTKAETLSAEDAWRCPHCQQYLPVVKTLGLWSLPDILVVHFKRFRQHQEKGANAAKLTTMVKFPLNSFDMSPHIARGSDTENTLNVAAAAAAAQYATQYRASPWKKTQKGDSRSSTLNSRDNRETRYDLYAVCYHQGDTLETGHYTAACKNPYDRQWYKFDDQRVSKVPEDCIQAEIINNEAYMLFYQRRIGEVSECSGSSSNSGDHWVSRIAPLPIPATALDATATSTPEEAPTKHDIGNVKEVDKREMDSEKTSALSVAMATPIDGHIKENNTDNIISIQEVALNGPLTDNGVNKLENMIEEFDFADADISGNEITITDKTKVEENNAKETIETVEDTRQTIFVMDEDVSAEIKDNKNINNNKNENTKVLVNAFHPPNNSNLENSVETPKLLNGIGKSSPTKTPFPETVKRSSPDISISRKDGTSSPTTIIRMASLINNNKNETTKTLLSSSLKSSSGNIIGATLVSHSSHDFRLSRHQHLQWNGSRSSVSSAVEHATQSALGGNPHHTNGHTLSLRHSFSTSSNYKYRECNETLSSMLRSSANTCSKDTLIFIDQQNHHLHHHHHHHHPNSLIEDDDDTFMDNRSLWISPVTPHKLITVSPKN